MSVRMTKRRPSGSRRARRRNASSSFIIRISDLRRVSARPERDEILEVVGRGRGRRRRRTTCRTGAGRPRRAALPSRTAPHRPANQAAVLLDHLVGRRMPRSSSRATETLGPLRRPSGVAFEVAAPHALDVRRARARSRSRTAAVRGRGRRVPRLRHVMRPSQDTMRAMWLDPVAYRSSLDSRAVTFENPTGSAAPAERRTTDARARRQRRLEPGEKVILGELEGPGVIRHVWMTFPPAPPEVMRALWIEVFYDGSDGALRLGAVSRLLRPSHTDVRFAMRRCSPARRKDVASTRTSRCRSSKRIRIELTNSAPRHMDLYYQLDYTLQDVEAVVPARVVPAGEPHDDEARLRHRRRPPAARDDSSAASSASASFDDGGMWYGEGEVKIYKDGDDELPTICGTGLEDYVGTAWGLGAHHAPFAGTPLDVRPGPIDAGLRRLLPLARAGSGDVRAGPARHDPADRRGISQREARSTRSRQTHPVAGRGWFDRPDGARFGIHERVDDYCAAAFVYCQRPQAVPRLDVASVITDIERKDYEQQLPLEAFLS